MRSTLISTAAIVLAGLQSAQAQTFSECNPMNTTCPARPALGSTVFYDFTKTSSLPADWMALDGTKLDFSPAEGLRFVINQATEAPTIALNKWIMYGEVVAYVKASPGSGVVSSVILLSDTLDEIDWEWRGTYDTAVQTNFFGKGNVSSYDRVQDVQVANPFTTVNKYTIRWDSTSISWLINDKNLRTLQYDNPLTKGGYFYPQTPMQVKLGSWVACDTQQCMNDKSCPFNGRCEWVGSYFGQTGPGPFVMSITNITVKDLSCGKEYSYGDKSGMASSIQGIDPNCSSGNGTTSITSVSSTTSSVGSTTTTFQRPTGSAPPLDVGQGRNNTTPTSNVPVPSPTSATRPATASPNAPSVGIISGNVASSLHSHASAIVFTVLGLAAAALLC